MMKQDELLEILDKRYSTDNKGDYFHVGTALTVGIVVDNDDPLQMGRVRAFCPAHSHDPSKIDQIPWAAYVSPIAGVVHNDSYERGDGHTTSGAVAHGFWAIPELGANVIIGCIDSDLRRTFWIGAIYDQQETHTLGTGRYKWSDGGNVDGPLSSSDSPIEPQYSNAHKAFSNKTSSPEWQSREADYTGAAIDKNVSEPPTPGKSSYLDQQSNEISGFQQFAFNKGIVSNNGYDWSAFGGMPRKAPRVQSWTSPGFASFIFDDRISNNRSKWKSSTGHMILLDDTNERIYIRTNTGNAWIEMDSAGNIDGYSSRRISLASDLDINLFSKQTVRIQGVEGVYINAGGANTDPQLSEAPASGQIRFQATDDIHMVTSKNYRHLSKLDTIFEIGANECVTVGGNMHTQVQHEIDFITNDGDWNQTITGDVNIIATGMINIFGINGARFASKGNVELYAYYGTLNMGAQTDITAKSISGNINLQAVGGNSGGNGAVNIKAPNSQISASNNGATISTNGALGLQTGQGISMQAASQTQQAQPIPEDQIPDISCSVGKPQPTDGYQGVDLCARVAYNAGFTGRSLVAAVAIAGAESRWNPNAIGDVGLQTDKWGPSCGFWQVRSLVHPDQFHYPDTLRDKNQLFDPQFNANAAFAFSNSGNNYGPWTTYMNKDYLNFVSQAIDAINRMCNPVTPTPSPALMQLPLPKNSFPVPSVNTISSDSIQTLIMAAGDLKPSVILTQDSVIIQTLSDVYINSVATGESIAIMAGIKTVSDNSVTTINEIINILAGCCRATLPPVTPIPDAGVTAPETQIPSNYFPYMNADSEQVFNLNNFDVNGGTIIQ